MGYPSMARKALAAVTAIAMLAQAGCYNTYNVKLEELAKAQEGGSDNAIELLTDGGEKVVVSENSKIGVTGKNGEYYSVSPFNFTLTRAQLVAPDEDLLLTRDAIDTGNVKLVSGTKTTLLVAAGVAVLAGVGIFIAVSAPEKKGFGQE